MIETDRLELHPLTVHQLELWLDDIAGLEKELHCSYQGEPLDGFFHEIVKQQLLKNKGDIDNYLWHSFWLLIRKTDRVVIGSADFKDIPNKEKEVEIGYGLSKEFEHHGYMTEAVQAMCAWAIQQDKVSHVIAETELDGYASQRILIRCGFTEMKRGTTVWWRV